VLAALIFLNLTSLPLMLGGSGSGSALANNNLILPSIILAQTALSLLLIWWFGHRRGDAIAAEADREKPPQRGAVAPA
jgi:hypothetical protein